MTRPTEVGRCDGDFSLLIIPTVTACRPVRPATIRDTWYTARFVYATNPQDLQQSDQNGEVKSDW
jgi:hypothetical protein